jgi:recombinational DNA repair protein (RecF pathway)
VDRCAICGTNDREVAFRWDPDRGGALCSGCARGGRPIGAEARAALARLAETSVDEAEAVVLAPDVNRACREALAEIINQHITGPLKSLEFISKLSHA